MTHVTDELRPAERWCRVCHRLEREVPMYRHHGAICRTCYLAEDALQKYWARWQREKLRMAPA